MYRVLVAEILLRRTQALQVEPVYERFLREFPGPRELARAAPDRIRELLAPLGLKWRAENMVRLAATLARMQDPAIPDNPDLLKRLPGVGDYVAAAVECFALNRAVPVVDTNTARVAARFFGIVPQGESRRDRGVQECLAQVVDPRSPREFNLALLDFAAMVCRARRPRCSDCPVSDICSKTAADRDEQTRAR